MDWEPVIGLEIHAQLKTQSKIFSGSSTQYGKEPNTQASIIDLGLPGVLPVLNKAVVDMAIKFGLAIQAQIAPQSVFARKNYFYPDLPKGYQISQYELPIVYDGHLDIKVNDTIQRIGITRAHLEEDAGKSLHGEYQDMTGIDLNRAGIPLLEIVSEPDLRSAVAAVHYMKGIHTLVTYLDICDGNMQEGSFRCDANVSIRRKGEHRFGIRTEIKNVNSFRFIEKAILYEIQRQIAVLESGGAVVQETRLYDANRNETRPMRSKEEAFDYRYFPDPDLLPVTITPKMIDGIKAQMPELPAMRYKRFLETYCLKAEDAEFITSSRLLADYFENVVKTSDSNPQLAANWITGELISALNKTATPISEIPVRPLQMGHLLQRIEDNTLSNKTAKVVFEALWQGETDVDTIIATHGLEQVSDKNTIETLIADILDQNPEQVEQYRAGKEKVFGYFVGQVMKQTQGKANPKQVNEILRRKLDTDTFKT